MCNFVSLDFVNYNVSGSDTVHICAGLIETKREARERREKEEKERMERLQLEEALECRNKKTGVPSEVSV